MNTKNTQNYIIIACGTLKMEIDQLVKDGKINPYKVLYTIPGLHQNPHELEKQLLLKIDTAADYGYDAIVIYGGKYCFIDSGNIKRTLDTVIEERENKEIRVTRIKANHCIDMIADEKERQDISGGEDVYWLTPGWMKYRELVYKGWDKGLANENFPKHSGGAIMLDAVGYYASLMKDSPEKILEFSDWMGIPIYSYKITLDRFQKLIIDQINLLES
jgi:hypothetical protein